MSQDVVIDDKSAILVRDLNIGCNHALRWLIPKPWRKVPAKALSYLRDQLALSATELAHEMVEGIWCCTTPCRDARCA